MWDFLDKMVKDKADNTNNRFAVGSEINRRTTGGPFPFWGCAPRDTLTTLQPKRPHEHGPGDLPEFRHADLAVKGASIWKLYYAGSIGGHAILGIPMLRRLKKTRAVKTWPFETGFKAITEADLDGMEALAAEVRIGLVPAQPLPGEAKELAPVRALAERVAKLDEAGKLGAAFTAPKDLAPAQVAAAEREEGWILNLEAGPIQRRAASAVSDGLVLKAIRLPGASSCTALMIRSNSSSWDGGVLRPLPITTQSKVRARNRLSTVRWA